MLNRFSIEPNSFLETAADGYYSVDYLSFGKPGNPDFLNTLKNTFNTTALADLDDAEDTVCSVLMEAVPQIMQAHGLSECVLVCVPRAKAQNTYTSNQLRLLRAVKIAASYIPGAVDATAAIIRHTDTRTTHLHENTGRKAVHPETGKIVNIAENNGDKPYAGITKDTCTIDSSLVQGKDVVLIDDIYTKTTNVDEDAIQCLRDAGAKSVLFYAVAKTKKKDRYYE